MCTILALLGVHPRFPVAIAANRDERYARPSSGPTRLTTPAAVVAGRDLEHGGTWFGIAESGLAVAIADQGTSGSARAKRSRGLLVLDALAQPSVAALERHLADLDHEQYNPCTLLYADATGARLSGVATADRRTRPLAAGLHVMVSGIGARHALARERRVIGALDPAALAALEPAALCETLAALLRAHDTAPGADDALCRHGREAGTVSSFVALLGADLAASSLHCAVGPPCVTEYADYSALLACPAGASPAS